MFVRFSPIGGILDLGQRGSRAECSVQVRERTSQAAFVAGLERRLRSCYFQKEGTGYRNSQLVVGRIGGLARAYRTVAVSAAVVRFRSKSSAVLPA